MERESKRKRKSATHRLVEPHHVLRSRSFNLARQVGDVIAVPLHDVVVGYGAEVAPWRRSPVLYMG